MSIVASYLLPHAPVFIESIGGDQTKHVIKTIEAYREVAKQISEIKPEIILMISPHGPIFTDAICIYDFEQYNGDLKAFGEFTLEYKVKKSKAFIEKLMMLNAKEEGYFYPLNATQFRKFQFEPKLDHGITVPLHFILEALEAQTFECVAMSYGDLSYTTLMRHGALLSKIAEIINKRVVLIASGDMSHALKSDGPYRLHTDGPWFDKIMCDSIKQNQIYDVFLEDEQKIANAAECGLRSFAILAGSLNSHDVHSSLLGYEGPFGVGYLIASFIPMQPSQVDHIAMIETTIKNKAAEQKSKAHLFVKIAWETIEAYVLTGKSPKVVWEGNTIHINDKAILIDDEKYGELLSSQRGVFVSIKKNSMLRGCIGTIAPSKENVLKEIISNAISACANDYRFDPIDVNELMDLCVNVDVLSELEQVENTEELDAKQFGIVVYCGMKQGVLLPDLSGVDRVEEQLKIATNKAGFHVDEIEKIDRFTVERFF